MSEGKRFVLILISLLLLLGVITYLVKTNKANNLAGCLRTTNTKVAGSSGKIINCLQK